MTLCRPSAALRQANKIISGSADRTVVTTCFFSANYLNQKWSTCVYALGPPATASLGYCRCGPYPYPLPLWLLYYQFCSGFFLCLFSFFDILPKTSNKINTHTDTHTRARTSVRIYSASQCFGSWIIFCKFKIDSEISAILDSVFTARMSSL